MKQLLLMTTTLSQSCPPLGIFNGPKIACGRTNISKFECDLLLCCWESILTNSINPSCYQVPNMSDWSTILTMSVSTTVVPSSSTTITSLVSQNITTDNIVQQSSTMNPSSTIIQQETSTSLPKELQASPTTTTFIQPSNNSFQTGLAVAGVMGVVGVIALGLYTYQASRTTEPVRLSFDSFGPAPMLDIVKPSPKMTLRDEWIYNHERSQNNVTNYGHQFEGYGDRNATMTIDQPPQHYYLNQQQLYEVPFLLHSSQLPQLYHPSLPYHLDQTQSIIEYQAQPNAQYQTQPNAQYQDYIHQSQSHLQFYLESQTYQQSQKYTHSKSLECTTDKQDSIQYPNKE